MYALRVILALSVSVTAFGQAGVTLGVNIAGGTTALRGNLRVEPVSPGPWAQTFSSGWRTATGDSVYTVHRFIYDDDRRIFTGYDMLLQPQSQVDTFRATFWELGLGVLDLPAFGPGKPRAAAGDWKKLPLASYPAAQMVRVGDTISVELWTAQDTGQKIIDDVHIDSLQPTATPFVINGQLQTVVTQLGNVRIMMAGGGRETLVPTVSGTARDFSAADAEMRLFQPRVSMNGTSQDTTAVRTAVTATGTLVWFHLPGHGRYILSLAPRPELGFVKAGEVRGGAITFTLAGDKVTLESNVAVATGDAPYILYVLHDPEWEPTAQAQRGHFQTGSVAPGEIELLRRK